MKFFSFQVWMLTMCWPKLEAKLTEYVSFLDNKVIITVVLLLLMKWNQLHVTSFERAVTKTLAPLGGSHNLLLVLQLRLRSLPIAMSSKHRLTPPFPKAKAQTQTPLLFILVPTSFNNMTWGWRNSEHLWVPIVVVMMMMSLFLGKMHCQVMNDHDQLDNPAVLPLITQLVYSRLSNLTSVLSHEISTHSTFCVKDPWVPPPPPLSPPSLLSASVWSLQCIHISQLYYKDEFGHSDFWYI